MIDYSYFSFTMSFFSRFAGVLLERLFDANDISLLEDKFSLRFTALLRLTLSSAHSRRLGSQKISILTRQVLHPILNANGYDSSTTHHPYCSSVGPYLAFLLNIHWFSHYPDFDMLKRGVDIYYLKKGIVVTRATRNSRLAIRMFDIA